MASLERAIELAAQLHAGQTDKDGMPYILHPLRVMMALGDNEARTIAVLHDILEDTSLTEDDLRREGFSESVLAGVVAVTRSEGEPYFEYVIRASRIEAARQVKIADLNDNARLDRVLLRPASAEPDAARMRRYVLSYKFLTGKISEADYRTLMNGE